MRLVLASLAVLICAPMALAQETPPAEEAQPQAQQGDIVVPGVINRPVPAPPGDPRSTAQRMRDVRAWDRCVMRAQGAADNDPTRYQAQTPEEVCSSRLGMANRTSTPFNRD